MKNALERALTKQRLQFEAAAQRDALARHAEGLRPLFHAADQVHAGLRWAGRHPEVVAGGVALLAASRPGFRRFLWRTGRNALTLWFWFGRQSWPGGSLPGRIARRTSSVEVHG